MQDVLNILTPADYTFLIGLIDSHLNLTEDTRLRGLLAAVEVEDNAENRAVLNQQLEQEIRYLGSADLAYQARKWTGQDPGVPLSEIVRDVAKKMKVDSTTLGTEREMLEDLVHKYVTKQFSNLSTQEQQELLESLGVERDRATSFLKKSAGVFAIPALIQAFGIIVVDGLIKTIIFGTIAKIIGQQLAMRLFQFLMGRLPWWVSWIGPLAWTASISWAVLDVQGPAYRKTIPILLYLGLCSLRERGDEDAG